VVEAGKLGAVLRRGVVCGAQQVLRRVSALGDRAAAGITSRRGRREEARFEQAFGLGFRELYLDDILRANRGDVRMGTFIMCAAFLDALALTYSAGIRVPNGKRGKWSRFLERYLGAPYEPIWDSYDSFRNKLLHNYSARGIAFTHAPENAHLHLQPAGDGVMLHRERFVGDVHSAFDRFAQDVRKDDDLRQRAFAHIERYPPMGLAVIVPRAPE